MSNRIDLTQFDAITKGPWEVIELPGGGIDIGVRYTNHGHRPVVNFTQRMGEQVKQIERDVADMNAIAAVPNLIAELKRCYEELDEIEYRLEMAEDVLGRSDWNSVYRELIVPPE
jgi:hypothetical protein